MSGILGTPGNDTIAEDIGFPGGTPGAGNDTISGAGGDDVIAGGAGNDLLIGDASPGFLRAASDPFAGIDVGRRSAPSFVDLDEDGDLDLLGGTFGTLRAYRRNADGSFTAMDGINGRPAIPLIGVSVGYTSSPGFTDLDAEIGRAHV